MYLVYMDGVCASTVKLKSHFDILVNEHVVLLMVHYFDVITVVVTNTDRLN